jgi:hypothetical protein
MMNPNSMELYMKWPSQSAKWPSLESGQKYKDRHTSCRCNQGKQVTEIWKVVWYAQHLHRITES